MRSPSGMPERRSPGPTLAPNQTDSMTGPVVWVARHGQTQWSVAGRHTSRTDVPLTAVGEQEAVALGTMLREEHFDLVESSPRQRAVRTAELAGFDPTIDYDLVEWDYGELEGL